MQEHNLTDSNFLILAAKNYDAVFPNYDEFNEDIKRIIYIKRLLNTYIQKGVLKERLLLNHVIILFNMFGLFAAKMLFFKLEGYEDYVKTILIFLNKMPDRLDRIGEQGRTIKNTDYKVVVDLLRALEKA